jgi:hypothetical protein
MPRQNPCVHAGKNILEREHLHGPGIDLDYALLDLRFPGSLNLRIAGAVTALEQLPDKPIDIAGREATDIFEDFGGGALHVEIVARNREQRMTTQLPGLKVETWRPDALTVE